MSLANKIIMFGRTLIDLTGDTIIASHVLSGDTFHDKSGAKLTGTMKNNGNVAPSGLNAGGSYTIPAGYHAGGGKVTANSLSSQTSANAAAADILKDKTSWVNGSKITGTMTNQGAKTASLNAGGSYTIPAGYHNGLGKVTANSLASQTAANAISSDILEGKTAWVNGSMVSGNLKKKVQKTGLAYISNNSGGTLYNYRSAMTSGLYKGYLAEVRWYSANNSGVEISGVPSVYGVFLALKLASNLFILLESFGYKDSGNVSNVYMQHFSLQDAYEGLTYYNSYTSATAMPSGSLYCSMPSGAQTRYEETGYFLIN